MVKVSFGTECDNKSESNFDMGKLGGDFFEPREGTCARGIIRAI
jgi:hypothetical protein